MNKFNRGSLSYKKKILKGRFANHKRKEINSMEDVKKRILEALKGSEQRNLLKILLSQKKPHDTADSNKTYKLPKHELDEVGMLKESEMDGQMIALEQSLKKIATQGVTQLFNELVNKKYEGKLSGVGKKTKKKATTTKRDGDGKITEENKTTTQTKDSKQFNPLMDFILKSKSK